MKTELHPRNRHRELYDFKQLIKSCPDLAKFVTTNNYGNQSIDFADPLAVKTLNKALLKSFYNIIWDIPDSFLCPPIPNRADYIHSIADLLSSNTGIVPRGKKTSVLDIGVGANCIYPLIGHQEYGWSFIGTDIDPLALSIANEIITQNGLKDSIEIRLQKSPSNIFEGILEDCIFDVSMCNPPFHTSQSEANAGTKRKWKNLYRTRSQTWNFERAKIARIDDRKLVHISNIDRFTSVDSNELSRDSKSKFQAEYGIHKKTSLLNFGGKSNELWCPGGEVSFIKQMIKESVRVKCNWFTSLVSKEDNLPAIYRALEKIKASEVRTINLGQGQKKSRIIAWKFS